jgi:proline iminopeptidase
MTSVSTFAAMLALTLLSSCSKNGAAPAPESAASAVPKSPASHCSREGRLFDGGKTLIMPDGVSVWYKDAGKDKGAPLYILHGGPGYNSYSFEKSVGALLEREFRVVYIDQRGSGRSAADASATFGMANTVLDIERIRSQLGHPRIGLLGHSFGGAVAAEYTRRYPERVMGVAFVETTPNLAGSVAQQVAYVGANATTLFPDHTQEVQALTADETKPSLDRLLGLYTLVSRQQLQRALDFPSQASQDKHEALDALSELLPCTQRGVLEAYRKEGYFDREVPSVAFTLPAKSLLIAGRQSKVIGEAGYRRAVEVWGSAPVALEQSGHFPYADEPEAFVTLLSNAFAGLR